MKNYLYIKIQLMIAVILNHKIDYMKKNIHVNNLNIFQQ